MQPISLPRVQQVPQQVTSAQGPRDTVAHSGLGRSLDGALFSAAALPLSDNFSSVPEGSFGSYVKKKKNLFLQIACNKPRKLMIYHSFRNAAFGVHSSTSTERWGAEVDTQTESQVSGLEEHATS